jgi:hypothetical protein
MIIFSTPGSMTWQSSEGKKITFTGEWTLKPKFYLDLPGEIFFDDGSVLHKNEKTQVVEDLLREANARGWMIVLPSSSTNSD